MATASPERLRRARREGDSPVSSVAVRLAALASALFLAPSGLEATVFGFRQRLEAALLGRPEPPLFVVRDVVLCVAPLVTVAAAVAVVATLVQTGGVWSSRRPERSSGRPRTRGYGALRGTLLSLALFFALLASLAHSARGFATAITQGPERDVLAFAGGSLRHFAWLAAAICLAASAIDLAVERALWKRRFALSPREAARERRDHEGDPQVKAARQRIHEEARS